MLCYYMVIYKMLACGCAKVDSTLAFVGGVPGGVFLDGAISTLVIGEKVSLSPASTSPLDTPHTYSSGTPNA